jgi:lysozyme family protein
MGVAYNHLLRNEYQQLFDTCAIQAKRYQDVDAGVDRIVRNRPRYEAVAARTGVPWYFIGILHYMECGCNFSTHLHNGDPLTARTVHVPRGYPKNGLPPFHWEESAEDALRLKKMESWTDWSVPGMLFKMELYNGFGYRPRGINSPYLWSFSNQYTKGKYTADGFYDPNAVSKQIGAAVLLRRMSERQLAVAGEVDVITLIRKVGAEVIFHPSEYNKQAETLQVLLNSAGQHLRVDGKAGEKTSDAFQRITGQYLQGDSRRQVAEPLIT